MHKYELTERGKILIAALIVLFLFILSGILMYKAWTNQPSDPPPNQSSESQGPPSATIEETPPAITDSPPPTGGVFTPPIISPSSDNAGNGKEEPSDTPTQTVSPTPTIPQTPTTPPTQTVPPTQTAPPAQTEPPAQTVPPVSTTPPAQTVPPAQTEPPNSGLISSNPSEGMLSFLFSPGRQDALDAKTASALGDLMYSPMNMQGITLAVETPVLSDDDAQKLMSAIGSALIAYENRPQRLAQVVRTSDTAGETFEVKLYFVRAGWK